MEQKKKFYQKGWFLWLCLIVFPPVGIILLWACHKEKKTITKIILTVIFALWFIIFIAANSGDSTHQPLYSNAEVKTVMNGTKTEKIGEYSIIKVKSTDVTVDSLTDWYFNYVNKNNYNWCMILYTDKSDNSGVYAIKGMVQKDVIFTKDEYGDYSLSDINAANNVSTYIATDKGTLDEMSVE